MNELSCKSIRRIIAVGINVPIGLLHFITGKHYAGPFPLFVNGYMMDILIPFGFYYLFCLFELSLYNRFKLPLPSYVKWIIVFILATGAETCQYFGLSFLGSTFDPLDIAMYALGASLAVLVDSLVLSNVFQNWSIKS